MPFEVSGKIPADLSAPWAATPRKSCTNLAMAIAWEVGCSILHPLLV